MTSRCGFEGRIPQDYDLGLKDSGITLGKTFGVPHATQGMGEGLFDLHCRLLNWSQSLAPIKGGISVFKHDIAGSNNSNDIRCLRVYLAEE